MNQGLEGFPNPGAFPPLPLSAYAGASGFVFASGLTINTFGDSNGVRFEQATAHLGDYFEAVVALEAGYYTLSLMCAPSTNRGIYSYSLDGGSALGAIDFYGSSLTFGVIKTASVPLAVPARGFHTLRFTATSKNASSSDYYFSVYWFKLLPS